MREAARHVGKGRKRVWGERGAPAGAGVIVDIQRGKYAISRPHKFSQSDEPPRAVPWPPHTHFLSLPLGPHTNPATRGSRVTYVQAAVYRSVHITRVQNTTRFRARLPRERQVAPGIIYLGRGSMVYTVLHLRGF